MSKYSSRAWRLTAFWLIATVSVGCSNAPLKETMAPGEPFQDCPDCPQMVVVPAGSFEMGSPRSENGRRPVEDPQHGVEIVRDFAVGKYEVTVGEFRLFVEATERDMSGTRSCWERYDLTEEHPVTCVSWQDASDYAQWMAQKTGKPYRLLSEAEWEYAARAGTTTARYWGNVDRACKFARISQCGSNGSAPVGQYRPNAVGLYDMMGNVWEWVDDCWNDSYVGAPADGSAWKTGQCEERALRGGSFYNKSSNMRSAKRNWNGTDYHYDDVGVRLARTLP